MLFDEPKLLNGFLAHIHPLTGPGFSALRRAEIAEMQALGALMERLKRFSALRRAEIAETMLRNYRIIIK